jgi:MFS family permease
MIPVLSKCARTTRTSQAWARIRTLGSAPREMWMTTVVVRVLLAFTYFTLASFFVAHVEFEFGYSDSQSTKLFGVWGCMISFFSLLTGPLIDYVGIRKALVVGALLLVVGLTMFAFTFTTGWMFALSVFVFVPAGIALGLPVCDVGSKQYSYAKNSNVVFSLAYSMNNVGAALGSLALFFLVLEFGKLVSAIDSVVPTQTPSPSSTTSTMLTTVAAAALTTLLETSTSTPTASSASSNGGGDGINIHNHRFSPQRIMLFVCAIVTAIAGLIAALTIGDVFVNAHGEVQGKSMPQQQHQQQNDGLSGVGVDGSAQTAAAAEAPWIAVYEHETVIHRPPPDRWNVRLALARFRRWLRTDLATLPFNPTFRRLFLCVFISLFTRHVFQQLNTVLPLYLYRVFGPDAPVNAFYAINPTIVSFLAPAMALATAPFDPYRVIIFGSFVASASLLLFVFFTPTYTSVAAALTLFSIGESIYSPALTRYVLVLSPDGYEGQYSALTSAPIFLGKVFVAIVSGDLLEAECPRNGSSASCGNVWLTIALVSFVTPVALALLSPYIHNDEVRMRLVRLNRSAAASATDERFEDHDNDDYNTVAVRAETSLGGSVVYRSHAMTTTTMKFDTTGSNTVESTSPSSSLGVATADAVANELRGGL